MTPADQLDQDLEALRLERAPQPPDDLEERELLAMARALRRLRPADTVAVPPAPPLRRRSHWPAAVSAIAAVAAVLLLAVTLRPVDVVHAAVEKLSVLTSYHTIAHLTETSIDPATGEKQTVQYDMEIWYDRGKYRIRPGEDLVIFDGDTEWQVHTADRRVTRMSGMPEGRMRMSAVDDLIRWFTKYPHTVEGDEQFNGRPAVRVAVQLSSDVTQYVWLDKQTFLPVGGRSVSKQGLETSWTERMEINEPIDPALFTYQPPEGFTVETLGRR
ncbi:MAG TPA: hypothetical protein VNT75_06225 [Symbiobacteriaceae bacterium]|nr:hypothetical protein [Symbiobacteriaceae bacterium]